MIRAISAINRCFRVGEGPGIEPVGQLRQRLVERLAAGQLGDHQEAAQVGPRADAFAGGDDVGHVDPQRPDAFEMGPFGRGGRMSARRIERARPAARARGAENAA